MPDLVELNTKLLIYFRKLTLPKPVRRSSPLNRADHYHKPLGSASNEARQIAAIARSAPPKKF